MRIQAFTFAASLLCAALFPALAQADDHGCQVLLCLSNPGGATQYQECVPPITKLYQDLAKGKAFPVCAGAGAGGGIQTSAPVHDPYYCKGSDQLIQQNGQIVCRSPARVEVECPAKHETDQNETPSETLLELTDNGVKVCMDYAYSPVQAHPKPNYMDVTVQATGKTIRVRY